MKVIAVEEAKVILDIGRVIPVNVDESRIRAYLGWRKQKQKPCSKVSGTCQGVMRMTTRKGWRIEISEA